MGYSFQENKPPTPVLPVRSRMLSLSSLASSLQEEEIPELAHVSMKPEHKAGSSRV